MEGRSSPQTVFELIWTVTVRNDFAENVQFPTFVLYYI